MGRTQGCQRRLSKVGHQLMAWAQGLLGIGRRMSCLPPPEKTRGVSSLPRLRIFYSKTTMC